MASPSGSVRGRAGTRKALCRVGKAAVALGLLSAAVGAPTGAAADDISDMKRMLQELQQQNQELMRRIATLEAEQAAQREAARRQAARTPPPTAPSQPPPAPQEPSVQPPPPVRADRPASNEELEQRVRDLEMTRTAQEDATRSIIASSLAKSGPRINEFLSLSGALEVVAGRFTDFSGLVQNDIILNTAELDVDIKVGPWIVGSLVLGWDPGTSVLFPTTQGNVTGVDRFTVDRGTITIGDPLRFPLFVKGGRDVIPFGTSTGFSRTSGLSIESPLTIQVFETRTNLVGIGFEFPTPPLSRVPPPVIGPPVQPLVIAPMVQRLANWIGYNPAPGRPPPLAPLPYAPDPAPFYGTINFYQGTDQISGYLDFTQNISASLGYRARGHCGKPYSELLDSLICPWSFDFSVDFNSSVFNSDFLTFGYGAFLNQIGNIPGLAVNLRGSFGPFSLIAEYNTALRSAGFTDGAGISKSITPSAWQVSLGYQFGWNPWVEKIGEQGTFVAVGFSQSNGLAGATQLINGVPTRVGFVPRSRLLLTASEWVLEGLKFTIEGSIDWDYPYGWGLGTGRTGWGILGALTFTF